jgi:hypothetical protein
MVFARRWRDGRITPLGNAVRARTPEDAVRQVGQAFTAMGAHDPGLPIAKPISRLETDRPAIQTQKAGAYMGLTGILKRSLDDSPASRRGNVRPPVARFLFFATTEYLHTGPHNIHTFCLSYVFFRDQNGVDQNGVEFAARDMPLLAIRNATQVGLHFTLQKNGVSGETIW